MTREERIDKLIQNGLLRQVMVKGERVLRCDVCHQLDSHHAGCSVLARLEAA